VYALVFQNRGLPKGVLGRRSTDGPVFDLQLCILLSFRRRSCHRKVLAGSLDADLVGSSWRWRYSLGHEINIFVLRDAYLPE
jgi:hypothetical protein